MIAFMRLLLMAAVVAVALPLPAQAQFEGLDLSGDQEEKPKPRTRRRRPRPRPTTPPPAATDTESKSEGEAADGLNLSVDTPAVSTPGGGMTFEALDVSATAEERQRMDIADALFKNEEYEKAAMAGEEIRQDPNLVALHQEAQYLIAKSLYRMGLYHSALGEFSAILAQGESGRFFRSSLEWLFFISRKTRNETVILDEIARYAHVEFPDKYRNEFRYLLARYHFVRGRALDDVGRQEEANESFSEVKRLALLIPRGDQFYARAKYLEGLS